jgi:DinB superfamily
MIFSVDSVDYVDDLRQTVTRTAAALAAVSDEAAARRPAAGKWSAKEIIGHLVDSAANNHQRFVRAQFQDDLVFSGYAQDAWVAVQAYQDAPWRDLLVLWREYNLHLARVMERVPEAVRLRVRHRHNLHQLAFQAVPEDQPTTLEYFMRDYVAHLHLHLTQLRALGVLGDEVRTAGASSC